MTSQTTLENTTQSLQNLSTNVSSLFNSSLSSNDASNQLVFYVNGKRRTVNNQQFRSDMTLLTYLRTVCDLTSPKLVCGEGGCGACTVLLSRVNQATGKLQHQSINACLLPLGHVDGAHIITCEGIGSPSFGLHPIQEYLAKFHASQCGFCTPGIVMSFYALLRNHPNPTAKQIEHVLDGNLCRCTGYRPILDAAKMWASDKAQNVCAMGDKCCKNRKSEEKSASKCDGDKVCEKRSVFHTCTCSKLSSTPAPPPFSESSALIFPPALTKHTPAALFFQHDASIWYRPVTLTAFLQFRADYPNSKIVAGNSELGIEIRGPRQGSHPWSSILSPQCIQEFNTWKQDDNGMHIGSACTIEFIEEQCHHILASSSSLSPSVRTLLDSILAQIHWFAGTQIRNVATLAGNIVTASPISDLNPVWLAVNAHFTLAKWNKAKGEIEQRVVTAQQFWIGYRKTIMEPEEVLLQVFVPFKSQFAAQSASPVYEVTHAFKQSRRRADDIAIVTAALQFSIVPSSSASAAGESYENSTAFRFGQVALAYGGMAATTQLALKTSAALVGQPFNLKSIESVLTQLGHDFPLNQSKIVPGGMAEYRLTLAASFLYKMFFKAYRNVQELYAQSLPALPDDALEVSVPYDRPVSSASQSYTVPPPADAVVSTTPHQAAAAANAKTLLKDPESHVAKSGEPVRHLSALKQASGNAKFTDDIQPVHNELHCAFVMSTEPHANILSVDISAAESCPGFVAYFGASDIPGGNDIGDVIHDEELFVSKTAEHVGALIGIVVAKTPLQALHASKAVKITYENLTPIMTIDEAIAAQSYICPFGPASQQIQNGNVTEALAKSPFVLENEVRMGGQEHFYLEPNVCIVTPGEDDTLFVTGTTQNPSKQQLYISHVLGIGAHKVTCHVKRLGGGFGGKETRSLHLFAAVALAAHKLKQPVRMLLDRETDFAITGQRHAFLGKYKVGFDENGKVLALDAQLYCNAGYSLDLSLAVLGRAMFHIDNAYHIPDLRVVGYICKTNQPSHTAFRGFGGPQGMWVGETVMDVVARKLNKSAEEVRHINLYQQGNKTHYRQELKEYTVPQQWDALVSRINVPQRRKEIAEFNSKNRYKKRGLAVIPTKFGISFTAKWLNQAGALVCIYQDGSVLISHGGTEMGQGLHTKMCQVAAVTLNLPIEMIYVGDTSTDKVPNSSATAASASSDLNGAAVQNACRQILERLKPLREANPSKPWPEICKLAYLNRISLAASGFYATPDIGYDWATGSGQPFNYYTTGVAYSEVEIDCLTGDHTVLESDIIMDVGMPLNPTIDVGQIEGAFVQGQGLFTTEEIVWGDAQHPWVKQGMMLTRGPGAYKLPTSNDIPLKFNIELWRDAVNSRAILSSKGIGEPPLFLASSIFFAIKDAVAYKRAEWEHAHAATPSASASSSSSSSHTHPVCAPFTFSSPATAERIRMACIDDIMAKCVKPGQDIQTFQTLGSF